MKKVGAWIFDLVNQTEANENRAAWFNTFAEVENVLEVAASLNPTTYIRVNKTADDDKNPAVFVWFGSLRATDEVTVTIGFEGAEYSVRVGTTAQRVFNFDDIDALTHFVRSLS